MDRIVIFTVYHANQVYTLAYSVRAGPSRQCIKWDNADRGEQGVRSEVHSRTIKRVETRIKEGCGAALHRHRRKRRNVPGFWPRPGLPTESNFDGYPQNAEGLSELPRSVPHV